MPAADHDELDLVRVRSRCDVHDLERCRSSGLTMPSPGRVICACALYLQLLSIQRPRTTLLSSISSPCCPRLHGCRFCARTQPIRRCPLALFRLGLERGWVAVRDERKGRAKQQCAVLTEECRLRGIWWQCALVAGYGSLLYYSIVPRCFGQTIGPVDSARLSNEVSLAVYNGSYRMVGGERLV
jgi:hypothetical protein